MAEPIDSMPVDEAARKRVLDADDRLIAAGSVFRYESLHPQLDALAAEAALATGFPIAAVSIVLRRSQRFVALYGAPPDLEVSRSTGRCVSFCQHVVTRGAPFEVEDALHCDLVRKELVNLYGIRAYSGVPIHVDGQVVGTLCVIDVQPRLNTATTVPTLLRYARQIDALLHAAAGNARQARELTGDAARPAFAEVRNILCRVSMASALVETALADVAGGQSLLAAAARGEITLDHLSRNAAALVEVPLALEDARALLLENTRELDRAGKALRALERAIVPQGSGVTSLRLVVDYALQNALHETRMVGGVKVEAIPDELGIAVEPSEAIAIVSKALAALAQYLPHRTVPQITLSTATRGHEVELRLATPRLAESVIERLGAHLRTQFDAVPAMSTTLDADGLTLCFLNAIAGHSPHDRVGVTLMEPQSA